MLALFSGGCHKNPSATVPAPPPAPTPAPAPDNFELGQKFFRNGDYARAAKAYEAYLRDNSSPADQDQAFFRLALSHAFPESPVRDIPKALELLHDLIRRFPQSPYKPQAEFLLSLQEEVEKLRTDVSKRDERVRDLTQELEKLKQIDMQRRPSRPPP